MNATDMAIDKIDAFVSEIDRILKSEFPFPSSKNALRAIKNHFLDKQDELDNALKRNNDPKIIESLCAQITISISKCLPFLGILHRSTNTRNAFEITEPLKNIAGKSLKNIKQPIQFVISSEWDYSPFISINMPVVRNFYLVGFPAHEASNPLILPVSGHEIGHPVWKNSDLEKPYRAEIIQFVRSALHQDPAALANICHDLNVNHTELSDASSNMFIANEIQKYIDCVVSNALKQCEEVFSDFYGICIFGESFIYSFSYLFPPYLPLKRSPGYPALSDRINYDVVFFKKVFNDPSIDFSEFNGCRDESSSGNSGQYLYQLIDKVVSNFQNKIADDALSAFEKSGLPKPNQAERERIFDRFSFIVPEEDVKSIGDIINAGWKAYCLNDNWGRELLSDLARKRLILKELLLKTIEVFQIKKEQKDASKG